MNNLDKQYTDLLQDILDNGINKGDRTGTGTVSVFGRTIRHKMSEGFPILTTKKIPFKTMATELCWFLRGDTNISWLVRNGCNIWNGDAYKKYENYHNNHPTIHSNRFDILSMKEFVEKIKTDEEFAKQWGELGPIYGAQWRKWEYGGVVAKKTGETYSSGEFKYDFDYNYVDQIANLIHDLKNNPDSRRLMVNAWNVAEIKNMTLPPCHYGFQVYTRELTNKELENYMIEYYPKMYEDISCNLMENMTNSLMDVIKISNASLKGIEDNNIYGIPTIPTRAISLMWNQRSVDTFLGLPFNIASYGLLLEILAKEVNMIADELIGNLGDTHLYSNHIEQAKEQIGHELSSDETNAILREVDEETFNTYIEAKKEKIKMVENQEYEKASKFKDTEREMLKKLCRIPLPLMNKHPFPLPELRIEEMVKWKEGDCLPYYHPDDFELIGYKSHGTIKAKLSN
jgi:thymidylate synthase